MPIVAGIDSSPSTTRVVVCDALSGRVLRRAAVSHAAADDPHDWWNTLVTACADGILDGVQAISVAGQRQALVTVDATGAVVRPALMASDHRAATAAGDLVVEGGGAPAWASAVGSVPTGSYPIAKLRWLAAREPENAARVAAAMQPHDWLTWLLLGGASSPVTDRGDASGTGYWSPKSGEYRMALLRHAFGREVALPRVLGPVEPAGTTGAGVLVAPGTGAARAAVLGLDAAAGDVVISVGASGTLFAGGLERPVADASGAVACFADATGRHLAMTRTGEAMPTLDAAASMLGTDLEGLSRLALESTPGAQGLVLLPPQAGQPGSLTGLRLARMTAPNLARAAVEGMLCGLGEGLDLLAAQLASAGTPVRRVILTGRGARLDAVRLIAPAILGVPVSVALSGTTADGGPPAGPVQAAVLGGSEIMAIGAARQAAWVLAASSTPGGDAPVAPPVWSDAVGFKESPTLKGAEIGQSVRAQYAGAREAALAAAHVASAEVPAEAPVATAEMARPPGAPTEVDLTATGVGVVPPWSAQSSSSSSPGVVIPHQAQPLGGPPTMTFTPFDEDDYYGRRRR